MALHLQLNVCLQSQVVIVIRIAQLGNGGVEIVSMAIIIAMKLGLAHAVINAAYYGIFNKLIAYLVLVLALRLAVIGIIIMEIIGARVAIIHLLIVITGLALILLQGHAQAVLNVLLQIQG